MGVLTTFQRKVGLSGLRNDGRKIALGIWAIACILLYDKVLPRVGEVANMGREFGIAANKILVIDKIAPFIPHRPFDTTKPKMVLLLAYQRVGSSFTAQMFNQNPDFFYVFEPVDGIYSAMYGTAEGFTVPSDIAYFWNGTVRQIPDVEYTTVAEVLGSLLTCDFDNVPTEVLIHRFFSIYFSHQQNLAPYIKCYKQKGISLDKCHKHIEDICPKRFGGNMFKEEYCRTGLWYRDLKSLRSNSDAKAFNTYHRCVYNLRKQLSACMPLLKNQCLNSKVRSTKTVRVNMETAEYMFRHFTNFRVVHLIRDPRAVALSRMGHPTFRGKNSQTIASEAALYCDEVLKDIQVRNSIEQRFPGSVMQVIYEHIVTNPIEQIKGIYSFLNETMPASVESWIQTNTDGAVNNSTKISEKWQEKITFKVAKDVSEACVELYAAVNYKWPS